MGPAGRLLDRIHQKPEACQFRACWPWLEAELAPGRPGRRDPGATAGQALFRITNQRGTEIGWCAPSPGDGAGAT